MQSLKQKVKEIKSGKLTAEKNVADFGEKIKKLNKDLNIFLVINTDAINQAKEIDKRIKQKKEVGKLAGLCFAVKSNICVKGLETNCASKVLESWIAPYNATVINKLLEEDAIILGMVNMDEFACGGSGETSAFKPCKNPKNKELIPGGSSSGPTAAVAADLCDFALGSDTGGSIRNPASHCGVVGLKPTYGSVSRYGLIDLCMSFDTIGPLANSVEDAELIHNIIKGQDNFDSTTKDFNQRDSEQRTSSRNYDEPTKGLNQKIKTIGLVDVSKFCNKEIEELINKKAKQLAEKNNYKIKKVSLPLDIALETYYILVYTEFFSGTRKFDGRKFGLKIEDASGPEVIRRIIGGSEITRAEFKGKFYRNALKAKNYIKEQFDILFKDCDILILPTVPRLPHKIGSSITVEEMYAYDVLTVPASIAGIPGMSIPAGKINNIDVGIQILANSGNENLLFDAGKELEI